jgi:hypothetical protein
MAGGVDRQAPVLAEHLAGDGIDLVDTIDLVAPQLDAVGLSP